MTNPFIDSNNPIQSLSIDVENDLDEFSRALLNDSMNCIDSTEEIGLSIMEQLHQQREQIAGSTYSLTDTQNITNKTRKLLKIITWKVCREKIALCIWIFVFSLIDAILAYRLLTNWGHL
tara:strand:- start:10195 stop:10554 length:360 start_codon:yes stop_codon:yes gene_type:complete